MAQMGRHNAQTRPSRGDVKLRSKALISASGAMRRAAVRRKASPGPVQPPAATLALLIALALLLGALAGCESGGDAAPAVATVVVERVVTGTMAPVALEPEPLLFDTAGSLWEGGDGMYSAAAEEDAFAWSNQIVRGPFTFSADVESDWNNYGEAIVVVYGDGEGWSRGCLILNVTSYWQGIRAHSIYDPEIEWLVQNEQRLPQRSHYRMTVRVTEDEARLYVDDVLAASAPLQPEYRREGRLALFKYSGSAPVTFRDIVFEGAEQMAAGAGSGVAQAVAPTSTRGPTRTATPTFTRQPSRTPAPSRTATRTLSPTPTPPPTETPEPTNTPPPPFRPATGMLVNKAPGGRGKLLIKNGTDADALVILTDMDEVAVKTAYIRASESFNMTGIRDGEYLLFYSKGEAFNKETYRFTQGATYQRMDTTIPFKTTTTQYTTWEITLYGVAGGTVGSDQVDPEDFP